MKALWGTGFVSIFREHPEQFPEQENETVDWATHKKVVAENARLKQENEFLRKVSAFVVREATLEDIYAFIEVEKASYKIAMMCRVLQVSRASFYRWRAPAHASARAQRHVELVALIKARFDKAEGRAGRDQLTRLLHQDGVAVSVTTVGAIMRELGLRSIRTRAWKKTTVQDPQANTAHIANHMVDADGKRDFTSQTPGTRLVGDITYLKTGQGWLYLCTVIDLATGILTRLEPSRAHAGQHVHRRPRDGP